MSGRPKVKIKQYTKDGELLKIFDCQRDFTEYLYGKKCSIPLWWRHPQICIINNDSFAVRGEYNIVDAVRFVSDFKHKKENSKRADKNKNTFSSWASMRNRCNPETTSKNNKKYYVDKGIKVCDEWNYYESFLKDMGERPSQAHSIDRLDNSKGYYKENCRWATITQQMNNRTTTRHIKMTFSDFAEIVGISKNHIDYHFSRGLTPLEIFNHFNKNK